MSQFVVAITVAVDDIGTEATSYYTDGPGWCTGSSDTPAETWVQPRLLDPGSYRRELFSGAKLWGAVRPSFGELVLANSDGALDAWLGYGVDGRAVVIYWGDPGGAFPDDWTVVLKCYGHSLLADFDSVRLRLRDRLELMEQPVCGETFAGTGGLEGGSDLAGRAVPRSSGTWALSAFPAHPLILLDATNLIYLASADQAASPGVYEGGVLITNSSAYSSASDLQTTAPSAGEARWYLPSGGPTYVRLGSTPEYDLRAVGIYPTLYPAQEAGCTEGTDAPAVTFWVDDGGVTWLDLAESACVSPPRYFGMSRLDVYETALIAAPVETADYTFTQHNARGYQRVPTPGASAPLAQASLNAGRVWPCESAGAATPAIRSQLAKRDWHSQTLATNPGISAKHPAAPSAALQADYVYSSPTPTAHLTLFGVERDMLMFTAPFTADTLALDLHDTVAVKLPRFGLADGAHFRIVAVELRLKSREIAFTVWG